MKLKKIKPIYQCFSYSVFNLLILFLLLNLVIYGYYQVRYSPIKDFLKPYLKKEEVKNLLEYYEGFYNIKEIYQIRKEVYDVAKYIYEPWVGFKEDVYNGKYINVTEEGHRLNSKMPQKLSNDKLTIFAFGGSTMFGYGVADNHTIPAFLERELPNCRVVNYGRAYYYSSQEMILFLNLLKNGNVPDIAIFFDGLNDVKILSREGDYPAHTDTLKEIISRGFYIDCDMIPFLRFAYDMSSRFFHKKEVNSNINARAAARNVLSCYSQNIKLIKQIADMYDVKVYFFIQPVPYYAYNSEYLVFERQDYLYQIFNEVYRTIRNNLPEGVRWLADIFKDKKYVYISMHHYNPSSCRMIAQEIAKIIKNDL